MVLAFCFHQNYTGDILNFETAVEMLHEEGITVGTVIIDDDVAVKDSLYTAGRRGVAGTVLLKRLSVRLHFSGYNRGKCEQLGKDVNNATRSLHRTVSLYGSRRGKPSFELADIEIEFGVGIHGEPGIERRTLQDPNTLIDSVIAQLLDTATAITPLGSPWGWIDASSMNESFDRRRTYCVN